MKALLLLLSVLLGLLQYRLFAGDGGLPDLWRLQATIEAEQKEIAALKLRNELLEAEVTDLKEGTDAIEARARRELGMIRRDETFFQLVEE